MKRTISVKLDDKTVEVSKLPLGKYSELMSAIKELPKHISGIEGMSPEVIIEKLPFLISSGLPDVISVAVIATDLKKEELEALGLDEFTRLVLAILEVNNFREVFENIKKIVAHPKEKNTSSNDGSTGQSTS